MNFNKIISKDISYSFDELIENYSIPNVITYLYEIYEGKQNDLIKKLFEAKSLQTTRKEIKTIGFYYFRYFHGGVEKVISLQMPIFLKKGYQVVLFTEEYNTHEEYPTPIEIKRVIIPKSYNQNRAEIFYKGLKEHNVDLMLYHQATSNIFLFDLLLIKTQGIPFIASLHNSTHQIINMYNKRAGLFHKLYALTDKLIVLSKMEESYYRLMEVNAQYLPNPIDIPIIQNDSINKKNEDFIIWIGRLDKNKNYHDAIKIIKLIVQQRANVQMVILGGKSTQNSAKEVVQLIEKNNLQNNIKWIEHTLDMDSWYRKAKIHLVTSSFESFSLVIAESKAYGIPLVTYSMPYLELLKNGKGYIEVPQNGIKEAAEAIIKLLDDNELWQKLSKEAKESIEQFKQFDQEKAWSDIIKEVTSPDKKTTTDIINKDDMKLFMETFYFHYGKETETIKGHKNFSVGKYIKYKILSNLTLGKMRKRYKEKHQEQKNLYRSIRGK